MAEADKRVVGLMGDLRDFLSSLARVQRIEGKLPHLKGGNRTKYNNFIYELKGAVIAAQAKKDHVAILAWKANLPVEWWSDVWLKANTPYELQSEE